MVIDKGRPLVSNQIFRAVCVFYFAICSISLAASQSQEFSAPAQARDAGYARLSFNDEFDAIDVDVPGSQKNTWYAGLWFGPPGPRNEIKVNSGVLNLTAPAGMRYNSITTVPRRPIGGVSFRHGYFESRMRFSPDPIDWSAFWLFSRKHSAGRDNGYWCEIDIFEHFGSNVFVGTVHEWTKNGHTRNQNAYQKLRDPVDVAQWHKYGLLWTPGKLSWYLDDRLVMSADAPAICDSEDLFLILGAQKHFDGPPVQLDVDWVRVYSE